MSEHEFQDIISRLASAPSSRFREDLRRKLEFTAEQNRRVTMSYMRPGLHTITPYLLMQNAASFFEFTRAAFGAEEVMRVLDDAGGVRHAEVRIDDSVIEFADAIPEYPARPQALHLYVRDVDAVHAAAVGAGAIRVQGPTDQDYGDRESVLRDPFGNQWYVATHKASGYRPPSLRAVTPYLHVNGASEEIAFLESAFGAETLERYEEPSGRIAHAKLRIGDSAIELGDAHDQWQPMPAVIQVYVPNVDDAYRRAVAAGAVSKAAPENKPYGERMAEVRDRHDNLWFLASLL